MCPVIAEMAWAHDGKSEARKINLEGAADSKAAAIKSSCHRTEGLHGPDVSVFAGARQNAANVGDVYQYLEKINLRPDNVDELIACAKARKLRAGLMPNDFPA